MWHKADPTPSDLQKWFNEKRLGKFHFPTGDFLDEDYLPSTYFVHLRDLYEMVVEWRINGQAVPIDKILAIVAFGSAVGPWQKETVKKRRKYLFFGPEIEYTEREYIQPNDADFLVITEQEMLKDAYLKAISRETYDSGTCLKRGGIHIVNRSLRQLATGIENREDTISLNAVFHGVPIFFVPDLDRRLNQHDIINPWEKGRSVWWRETDEGLIVGEIRYGR